MSGVFTICTEMCQSGVLIGMGHIPKVQYLTRLAAIRAEIEFFVVVAGKVASGRRVRLPDSIRSLAGETITWVFASA